MKKNKIVSFDFDDTLCMEDGTPNVTMIELVKSYYLKGFKCIIVTARNKKHETVTWIRKNNPKRISVQAFIEKHKLPIVECHFLNHAPKGPRLRKRGVAIHYDDRENEIQSAIDFGIDAKYCLYDKSIKRRLNGKS